MTISNQKGVTLVEMLISTVLFGVIVLAAGITYETAARNYFDVRSSSVDFADGHIGIERLLKMARMANRATVIEQTIGGWPYQQLNLRLDVDSNLNPRNTADDYSDDTWISFTTRSNNGLHERILGVSPMTDPSTIATTDFSTASNPLSRQESISPSFVYNDATSQLTVTYTLASKQDYYNLRPTDQEGPSTEMVSIVRINTQ